MNEFEYLRFEADLSSASAVSAYDEAPLWSAMFGLLLLEHVPFSGVRNALDVGCGTGFPLLELAERLGPDTDVHGIDPWGAALARAREKVRVRCVRNVTVHECSGAAMPFRDRTFDLIVSNLGVNNFEDAAAVVHECRRVARDGATFALTTNLQGHMREFYAIYQDVLVAVGANDAVQRLHEHMTHRATVAGTRALLENGGFSVTRVIERVTSMRFASGTALLNHYFVKLGFLEGWKNVAAGQERPVFGELQRRLDAYAHEKRELSLTIPMAYIEASAT